MNWGRRRPSPTLPTHLLHTFVMVAPQTLPSPRNVTHVTSQSKRSSRPPPVVLSILHLLYFSASSHGRGTVKQKKEKGISGYRELMKAFLDNVVSLKKKMCVGDVSVCIPCYFGLCQSSDPDAFFRSF